MLEVRPRRRIVYIAEALKVEAFKLLLVRAQAVRAARKVFMATVFVAFGVKTQKKGDTTYMKCDRIEAQEEGITPEDPP